jgi:hypothetical protein
VTDPQPDPLLPAAVHPATRSWLRRWLGAGAALTLLGVVLLGSAVQSFTADTAPLDIEAVDAYDGSTATTWLGAFGLLGVGFGLPFLVLTVMLARRLRRDPWREVVSSVDSSTPWWSSVPTYTVTIDGTPMRIAGGMWVVQGPVFDAGDPVTLWVAGSATGRSIPVAPPGGGSVFRGVARHDA